MGHFAAISSLEKHNVGIGRRLDVVSQSRERFKSSTHPYR